MYADAFFHDEPLWSSRPGRRLAVFLLPASIIVAAALTVLRMPIVEEQQPLAELLVYILSTDPEEIVTPPAVEPVPPTESVATDSAVEPARQIDAADSDAREYVDWYAAIPDAVEAVSQAERTYSVNPNMDERRRVAAEKFRRSEAPVERPIWENVVTDTMGRTLLVSGDCYRVLDDPRVGNRDAFLVFGQYMATCAIYDRPPQELPFVKEIQARREGQARYGRQAAE